ncbi:MAG TPA: glycosyltransferase [Candidatus Krumholzibacteria bacterium]|nr:glycosyltransferase [Candidatus Krumholzibacteria bacterium]
MRVLVITGLFPNRAEPVWGVHVFNNVRALSALCEVRVIAPVAHIPGLGLRRGRDTAVPERDTIAGIPVVYPRWPAIPLLARPLHPRLLAAALAPAARTIIDEHGADVILSYFAYPYGVAALATARHHRLPAVVSCRGSDINRMARAGMQRRRIAAALCASSRVIAVSRALAEQIEALGVNPARLHVVPNGIDTQRFAPADRGAARRELGRDENRTLVACVSRLSPEKGIDVLLGAWPLLARTDIDLVLLGDGPERRRLEALAASLGISERVHFAGATPHAVIPRWLAASDVAVLPSRMEGYPNAVVEALACGRPVVASRVGGVPEIIGGDELGVLVPPGDAAELAAGLNAALARSWTAETLSAAVSGRRWSAVASETLAVLEGALAA